MPETPSGLTSECPDHEPGSSFLERCLEQIASGRAGPLAEALARHPGHEDTIIEAWLEHERGRLEPEGSAAGDVSRSAEGRTIGPYRLLQEIGRGGQATVWLAEDTRLRRHLALKVFEGPVRASEDALRRFRREAEAASRLDHPGICTVYDTGVTAGAAWIAMRLIAGESLARRISRIRDSATPRTMGPGDLSTAGETVEAPELPTRAGPMTRAAVEEAVRIVEEAARALDAAHEAGILHRDVKPGNIMVTPEGRAVVLDFGLASIEDSEDASLTRTGDLFGTPAYMSPEQLAGQRIALDRRTDVWALGVTLYEALTLRRPFEAPTRQSLYQTIMTKDPPSIRDRDHTLSADLDAILDTALEKDRDRRYRTALALAEDLRRFREMVPVSVRRAGPVKKTWRWARRNPRLAVAVAALAISLIGGTAASIWLWRQAEIRRVQAEQSTARAGRLNDDLRALLDEASAGARAVVLLDRAGSFDPVLPEQVPSIEDWLDEAASLGPVREQVREYLRNLSRDEPAGRRNALTGVASLLERLHAEDPFGPTVRAMERRRDLARRLSTAFIADRSAWAEAVESVAASPRYGGLRMTPLAGFRPLGSDPQSGLWEFADLRTGEPPIRERATGRLLRSAETSLVFVLVPGGVFQMGAQRDDPSGPNYDPAATPMDGPPVRVVLSPFLLSKYEMSQGQWSRVTGTNPSEYRPGRTIEIGGHRVSFTLEHPVERVSFDRGEEVLRTLGFMLPTAAQWECACRAGSDSALPVEGGWKGLEGYANLLDASAALLGFQGPGLEPFPWEDGYAFHAPVGSFSANAWGFHDLAGNVAEWCQDAFHLSYDLVTFRAGDGLMTPRDPPQTGSESRSLRGSSWVGPRTNSRSAARLTQERSIVDAYRGVRPARGLQP